MAKNGSMSLFNDAHHFLQNVAGELDLLKKVVQEDYEARKQEIDETRKELERERFERREQISKLRYEFEEFVHRKIDKVLEEIEEMKRTEKHDDTAQQQQIDGLISDLDRLKENLFSVQSAWGKLVANCLAPPTQAAGH